MIKEQTIKNTRRERRGELLNTRSSDREPGRPRFKVRQSEAHALSEKKDSEQSVKCITCFSAGAEAAQAFFMGS